MSGGDPSSLYKAQVKQAGVYIRVDPLDRFKTEQQKAYTDKNLKKLLEKTGAQVSDDFATRDRDFMEYTQSLNAQEATRVQDFVNMQGDTKLSSNYYT